MSDRTQIHVDDRVQFGDIDRPREGVVSQVNVDHTVEIVVDDFLGRRTLWTISTETVRRLPTQIRRRA